VRSWQFHCDNTDLNFPLGTWIPNTAPATNFNVECPHNYFISGLHVTTGKPALGLIWSFYCSATFSRKLTFCNWTKSTNRSQDFTISLPRNDTVITRIETVFDLEKL